MEGNFTCSLCLDFDSESAQDHFTITECGHLFHHLCLKNSFDNGHKKCPICRKVLVPEKWRRLFGVHLKHKKPKPRAFKDFQPTASSSRLNEDYDYRFKVILVGTGNVGKSCLMQRFADGTYSTAVMSTVACDWRSRICHIGNSKIQICIWDTAGQERHRSLVSNYTRDTHGALLVYDITDEDSFKDIEVWDKFVTDHAPDTVKILLGNKTDLQSERKVEKEKGKALARKLGMYFMETSALDDYNVEAAFRTLAAKVLESEALMRTIELKKQNPNLQLEHADQVSDSTALVSACSSGLKLVKIGFNSTVNGAKSAWKFSTSSISSSRSSSSPTTRSSSSND